jgi:D-alanyl-D-alanine carboxypeptidase
VILEEPCGEVVWAANENATFPPASLTKIATALVAVELGDLDETIDVTVDGAALAHETDATVMGLRPGMRLTLRDLLYGLLMRSGNDAAIQISLAVAGSERDFVELMNEKAEDLGLEDTHFTNPHGMDAAGLYTSAHDIALLGHELLQDPLLAEIVRTQTYKPAWDEGPMDNTNLMLSGYRGSIGIKTGFTDQAGQTIVAAAEDTGRVLVVSVLKSQDRYRDAGRLLDWGFNSSESVC